MGRTLCPRTKGNTAETASTRNAVSPADTAVRLSLERENGTTLNFAPVAWLSTVTDNCATLLRGGVATETAPGCA
ncbi:hypothetical protein D3C87_1426600 [compost metagenome]